MPGTYKSDHRIFDTAFGRLVQKIRRRRGKSSDARNGGIKFLQNAKSEVTFGSEVFPFVKMKFACKRASEVFPSGKN